MRCAGIDNNIAVEINDTGTFSRILYVDESQEGAGQAIPSGVSTNGNIAGVAFTQCGDSSSYEQVTTWTQSGCYQSGATDYTYALGINDAGVSVGNDTGAKGSNAAEFSLNARGAVNRALLKPPKNTSWIGVATGINDVETIVVYAPSRAVAATDGPFVSSRRETRKCYPSRRQASVPPRKRSTRAATSSEVRAVKLFFIATPRYVSSAATGGRGRECRRLCD